MKHSMLRQFGTLALACAAVTVAVASGIGVQPGVAAASSVSTPTVQLSSTVAGASGVIYTVGFTTSATGAIPAGGSITLVAPTGTIWPDGNSDYALTDSTTSSGSFTSASGESFADPGLNLYNWIDGNRGAAVSITVPNAIDAGDQVRLAITGVVNPDVGSHTLSVSSSVDASWVTSSSYAITDEGSVSTPTVQLSSTVAGASGVTYTVGFTTSATGAIPAGGSITLVAPTGTIWPDGNSDYALTDSTTSSGSFTSASGESFADPGLNLYNWIDGNRGAAVSITVPNAIDAGDQVRLAITGVVNPDVGSHTLSVSSSVDASWVTSSSYAITDEGSVSTPTVQLSSTVAGASGVTYTVGFTTSATGAIPAGGSITLVAPTGTIWPDGNSDYALTDSTTSSGSFTSASGESFADPGLNLYNWIDGNRGAAVSITVPNAIDAGDQVRLAITGVVNPDVGSHTLSVSSSVDASWVTSSSYAITDEGSVSTPTVQLSSTVAGASGVTYTVGFTTSATGAIPAGGSITLVAPTGTIWPDGNSDYALTDSTTSSGSFTSASGESTFEDGALVVVTVPNAVDAGDALSLAVSDVTSAGAGSESLSVSTSTDLAPTASDSYVLTGSPGIQTQVSNPTFSATSGAAKASGVTYTVGFTTSATGGLAAGSSVTLVAPAGTIFGSCPYGDCGPSSTYTFTDATNPSASGSTGPSAIDGSIVSVNVPHAIAAGDQVSLAITAVTNPPAGTDAISLSTSADTDPVTLSDPITTAKAVSNPTFSATSGAAKASGVTYTVGFTTSATGGLAAGSSVTLVAPAGTIFGSCPYGDCGPSSTYTFTDATNPSASGSTGPSAIDGSIVSVNVPHAIAAGDQVSLAITAVTNPPAGTDAISLSTSADTDPVTLSDPITTAKAVSNPTFSATSGAAKPQGSLIPWASPPLPPAGWPPGRPSPWSPRRARSSAAALTATVGQARRIPSPTRPTRQRADRPVLLRSTVRS